MCASVNGDKKQRLLLIRTSDLKTTADVCVAESGAVEEQISGDESRISLCRSTRMVDGDTCLPGELLKLRRRIDGTWS